MEPANRASPSLHAQGTEPASIGQREMATLLASRGMVLVLGILTQSLLAYTLMPAGRGAYAVCVLFGDLAGVLVTLGSGRGAQYFVMTRRLGVSQGLSVAFAFCLIGSALAVIAAVPLIHSDLSFFGNAEASAFRTAILLIPTSALAFAAVLQLEGLRRFGRLAAFSLLRAAVVAAGILIWVRALGLGVHGAVLSLALGHLTMLAVCLADLRRHCGLVLELPSRAAMREVLRYGLREYPARIGQAIESRIGTLLLGMLAGRADIGLFAAANALITRVNFVQAAVTAYLLPRTAGEEAGRPELAAFCARAAWWTVGGMLLIWFAVSAQLVPVLLSEAFMPVTRLTWIMSIGVLAYAGAEIFAAYFRGTDRPQLFSFAMWLGFAVNILLFFALYPAWGLHGAAWAMTGGLLACSLVLWTAFHKDTKLPLSATLLLRRSDLSKLRAAALNLLRSARPRDL